METREQVLSRVKDEVAQGKMYDDYTDCFCKDGLVDIIDSVAIRFNEEMEKQNGWISVDSDIIPPYEEEIIILTENNKVYSAYYGMAIDKDEFGFSFILQPLSKQFIPVIKWQYMPKPPQQ